MKLALKMCICEICLDYALSHSLPLSNPCVVCNYCASYTCEICGNQFRKINGDEIPGHNLECKLSESSGSRSSSRSTSPSLSENNEN